MKTLVMTVGLPRSGKSGWVENISKMSGAAIVNPDSIRVALTGQKFVLAAEQMVAAIARIMVRALFNAGHDIVIIDATHGTKQRRWEWLREWKEDPDVQIALVLFKTPLNECLRRCVAGDRGDLLEFIHQMHSIWTWPEGSEVEGVQILDGLSKTVDEQLHAFVTGKSK